jgi:hypothetical protein
MTARQWRHETLDLDDGDRLYWTVDDNHRRVPRSSPSPHTDTARTGFLKVAT